MYKIYKNNCETEDEIANLHLVSDNIIDQKSIITQLVADKK